MKIKNTSLSHLLEINLAMIFVSTSGALGRYIDLAVPLIIATRSILALLVLVIYCKLKGFSFKVEKMDKLPIVIGGLFLGLHWLTYFYSLKLSNVAIGMLSLFTYPILTSFLEPLFLKTKFQKIHLLLGLLVLIGIYFLVPSFDLDNSYTIAVAIGVLSALFYALRNIILKKRAINYNGSSLMCFQLFSIVLFMSPAFVYFELTDITSQWQWLVLLAVLTTAIGHTLFLNSFKHFSITTASILSCVQPIFGIVIVAIFLKEIPTMMTVLGGLLILSSVVIESVRSLKSE
ncbi:DMT family transporter [Croceitalea rosinachiae]|uniref:DMT family transporter n=1 Tax=Croceitalea rosinachiae TaxID=3075596 RepID=A0ABU3ABN9_9FLAO|nr:DMT family transporter [Croceitalea sp. F388]MDT0607320.1 DMT family transporter [Croceitalea sp. F388]